MTPKPTSSTGSGAELRPKILVMDDSETVLEVTEEVLTSGGYDVITVSSSAMLPTVWTQQRPDLALIDVSMPVMKGQVVIDVIRRSNLHRCPLVLHSDQPEARLQELARGCGATGYIRKTSDGALLLKQIAEFVRRLQPEAPESPGAPFLVFVVDDSAAAAQSIEAEVRAAGGEPVLLEGGARCLAELDKRRPSLVLINLRMGGMSGDACCQAIRENRSVARLPIVMISGDSTIDVMQAWRAGADDFLIKPVGAEPLAQKIRAIRAAAALPAVAAPMRPRPVMLVEHSPFYRGQLGGLLECSGYPMLYAKNSAEALVELGKPGGELGAAVVDLDLPGAKPLELIAAIKSQCRAPVLAISDAAPSSAGVIEAARLTGSAVVDKKLPCEFTVKRLNEALSRQDELRVCERVPFFSLVDFQPASGAWNSGYSFDLSPAGIFVTTLNPEPANTSIELRINFPGRAAARCTGRVAWANPFGRRATYSYMVGMGVQFIDPGEDLSKLVAQFTGRGRRSGGTAP